MSTPAPFISAVMGIEKDWIDYNGHLNMAYYNVLFDRCSDEAFAALDMGPDYARNRRLTIYSAEVHVCYVQELHLDHKVRGSFQLIDHDEKRLRFYQEIRHVDGWLAATSEQLALHVDMSGPKVAPFPADVLARVEAMRAAHAQLPMPERAGRSIGIRRKSA
ncbi:MULTISPECIES: thioesterase family protein [unclassified Mesorhizobium]|uniref:thioesterase family protein n=1 Tax=unclassified Mesorhizobium TaxID=325217 RepID=UPI00086901ED|nr:MULTISPECIES: thioesterase family protein [unclassified Mesorhizobium]MBN9257232.1 thioesterase family protein [Mesorhizobium sp.]MBN9272652.1 thioesterase family protein [Mesorhizobium sp.]ODT19570.1 MAG: thioesterase [Mesorhizobium sp. SCN 65-12]OJX82518.1 MAG: thioesterase [Mesorhizobium sp. 65-26]